MVDKNNGAAQLLEKKTVRHRHNRGRAHPELLFLDSEEMASIPTNKYCCHIVAVIT